MKEFLTPITVTDGEYSGRWSGHTLRFEFEGQECSVQTDLGVRGLNVPVTFRVVGGRVDEESIVSVTGLRHKHIEE